MARPGGGKTVAVAANVTRSESESQSLIKVPEFEDLVLGSYGARKNRGGLENKVSLNSLAPSTMP